MKTTSLFALFAGALLCATASTACEEPDVASFEPNVGTPKKKSTSSADEADLDSDGETTDAPKKNKGTKPASTSTGGATKPSKTAPTPAPSPAKETPQQCTTKCVAGNASAAALDACANRCADNDTDCLGTCFTTSGCETDATCTAVTNSCASKCNPTAATK